MNPEPVITIIGVVHSDREIEIKSVIRQEAVRAVKNARETNLTAELIGKEGQPVASAPLHRIRFFAHGDCGCDDDKEGGELRYP